MTHLLAEIRLAIAQDRLASLRQEWGIFSQE